MSRIVRLAVFRFILPALAVAVLLGATSVSAMSLKDYVAMSTHDQAVYSGNFIEKITADLGRTNPKLMQTVRDWFAHERPDGRAPEGEINLQAEIGALQLAAREREVIDLSKIQVEGVIVKVIKDKFQPKTASASAK